MQTDLTRDVADYIINYNGKQVAHDHLDIYYLCMHADLRYTICVCERGSIIE